jgi:formylglycine-generating enzyme required for sulfatase activity
MRYLAYITSLFIIFITFGCAPKAVKNPEMLALSNLTVSYIRGEEFVMGTYDDKFLDKAPRTVKVSDYYIDKKEVTNALYLQYMGEAAALEEPILVRKPKHINDPVLGAPELPIVSVSHQEAKEFCHFYNKRLPTEAEWEFAAKGSTQFQKFYWGNDENPLYMNFRDSNTSWAKPVASYPPNIYGLYDMLGNVREWVDDTYEKDFYKFACSKLSRGDNCYENPLNSDNSPFRSNRGGSFDYSKGYPATISFRFFEEVESYHDDLGFRCAASEKEEKDRFSIDTSEYDGLRDDVDIDWMQQLNNKLAELLGVGSCE